MWMWSFIHAELLNLPSHDCIFTNMLSLLYWSISDLNLTWYRADPQVTDEEEQRKWKKVEVKTRGGKWESRLRQRQKRKGNMVRKKKDEYHTVCLLFFAPREKPMTPSDGIVATQASLNWETANNKNPLGVVCVNTLSFLYLWAKREQFLRRGDTRQQRASKTELIYTDGVQPVNSPG